MKPQAIMSRLTYAVFVVIAGCGPAKEPKPDPRFIADAPPQNTHYPATEDCARRVAAGIEFCIPGNWKEEKATSSMRLFQFTLRGEAGDGELVAYHFGSGQGGTREANITRWVSQFSGPSGEQSPPRWETRVLQPDGLEVTLVNAKGTYRPSSMDPNTPAPAPKPNYAMCGFIIEGGPEGTIFVKATGPDLTMKQFDPTFERFARTLRPAKPS